MSREKPSTPESPDNGPSDTGHVYDGIREYDNPLPSWWVWSYWITILWAIGYMFFAMLPPAMFSGPSLLAQEKNAADLRLFGALPTDLKLDDATILSYSKDEKWVHIGRGIFQSNCVTCHGTQAQGDAGPNMTDNAYIYVKTPADFADVISKGRKDNAMPAWQTSLSKNQILMVAAYVTSLRNTNVAGKKTEGAVPAMLWGQAK